MDNNNWPEFPEENKFDWSRSLSQIDKKYSPPLKQPAFKIKASKRRTVYVTSENDQSNSSETFIKKLAKKYPHIYELLKNANPDLPRWIFDNLIVNKKPL